MYLTILSELRRVVGTPEALMSKDSSNLCTFPPSIESVEVIASDFVCVDLAYACDGDRARYLRVSSSPAT
jgi:hypothetical protein